MDTLVSIIIPHWNGIDVLSECIDSLNNTKQDSNLIDALKRTCRKFTKQKTGKRPLANINLIRI